MGTVGTTTSWVTEESFVGACRVTERQRTGKEGAACASAVSGKDTKTT